MSLLHHVTFVKGSRAPFKRERARITAFRRTAAGHISGRASAFLSSVIGAANMTFSVGPLQIRTTDNKKHACPATVDFSIERNLFHLYQY